MEYKKYERPASAYPPLLRLILWLGRPFGVIFVPEKHVQVINHMGRFRGVKEGPELTRYNVFTETLGPLVHIGGQVHDYVFNDIIARDVLPVTLHLKTTIGYDPRDGLPDLAQSLTRLPRDIFPSIAETYLRWVLLRLANRYNATELTQHEVMAQVEQDLREHVNEEMKFLGIQARGKIRILKVEIPTSLTERQALIAQRRANILAGTEFHEAEFRRALVTEVIEHLGRGSSGENMINFSNVLETYSAEHKAILAAPQRIIEQRPQPSQEPSETKASPPSSSRPKSRL